VSPNTALDKFYSFNAATDIVQKVQQAPMIVLEGVLLEWASFFPSLTKSPSEFIASFIVLNNGDVSIPLLPTTLNHRT
jgi:hypothetical protein